MVLDVLLCFEPLFLVLAGAVSALLVLDALEHLEVLELDVLHLPFAKSIVQTFLGDSAIPGPGS